jgi:hypothetical protein
MMAPRTSTASRDTTPTIAVIMSTPHNLQVSISEAMTAQFSPPPSGPGEESVLAIESDRPNRTLDCVGVDFDAAVDGCQQLFDRL